LRYAAPVHPRYDVAIIGAGIAGLAASVLMRTAGMRVICLDPQPYPRNRVGESLDWSSPRLLRSIGIDLDRLLSDGAATHKKKIVVYEIGKEEWQATPPPIIGRSPLRFQTMTFHVDRTALDARLYQRARALGTDFIWERQRKVCLWTYFDTLPLHDGTAFFVDNRDGYLSWVWDIPISPQRTSIGYVISADALRDRQRVGRSVEEILRDELSRHTRFHSLLAGAPVLKVERTSFQPYVTKRVCGGNWLMVGEAAAMPDPLTGNGVTSGIRHARHATDAILHADGDRIPTRRRRLYAQHVFRLGHSFNAHIEQAIYRHPIRWGLGLQAATYIYTFFAFFMNALHARFDPRGRIGMPVFSLLFLGARGWIAGWTLVARTALWYRGRLHSEG